jgi:CelD/BcsL family acetyltransferase involved in cellulose biosynthesis
MAQIARALHYEAAEAKPTHSVGAIGDSIAWTAIRITSVQDIALLKFALDAIDGADAGVVLFQTSGWLAAAARAALSSPRTEIRILLAKRAQVFVAAIPFSIRTQLGIRIATPLGDPLSQYSDILMDDEAYEQLEPDALASAFALMPDVDVFSFRRVREDAKINKFIRCCHGEQVLLSAAPFSDLTRYQDFDAFLKAHRKAHRNRNRLRRRAQNEGGLSFEVAMSRARAAELARHALALKREWLRQQFRLLGTLKAPEWCEALVDAVEYSAPSTEPLVTALHAKGRPAAIEVGFVRRGRYYAFLGAYDPEFASWSPTDLLMEDTVSWCFGHNIACYDLLPPDDPYKAKWTNGSIAVADWMICRSLGGRWYVRCRSRILRPLLLRLADGAAWIARRRTRTAG